MIDGKITDPGSSTKPPTPFWSNACACPNPGPCPAFLPPRTQVSGSTTANEIQEVDRGSEMISAMSNMRAILAKHDASRVRMLIHAKRLSRSIVSWQGRHEI